MTVIFHSKKHLIITIIGRQWHLIPKQMPHVKTSHITKFCFMQNYIKTFPLDGLVVSCVHLADFPCPSVFTWEKIGTIVLGLLNWIVEVKISLCAFYFSGVSWQNISESCSNLQPCSSLVCSGWWGGGVCVESEVLMTETSKYHFYHLH